jgi:hypothetical protein
MAAYTGIQGQNILIVSSDPSNPTEGQIWYNSTTNLLKGYQYLQVNAWATGGNLNTGRYVMGSAGTQTAALSMGGSPYTGATELYDGTSWTSNPTGLNVVGFGVVGIGTQTAAVAAGRYTQPGALSGSTENWNGSSWSPITNLNTTRYGGGGSGTQTAGLVFGGYAPTNSSATEEYNGSTWTNKSSMNTARGGMASATAGTSTAALSSGGTTPSNTTATESYNGTSWTTVPGTLNTARAYAGGAGTQTAALTFGGDTPSGSPTYTTATELWNGTSWTSNPTGLANARYGLGGTGTQSAALAFGGDDTTPGSSLVYTEEWTGSQFAVRTITTS